MNRKALAWAGGFFSGEGSTVIQFRRTENKSPRPAISIQHNTKEELNRFKDALGLGKIYGPYTRPEKTRKNYYQFHITGFEKVQATIAMLWLFLSKAKQNQAIKVLRGV